MGPRGPRLLGLGLALAGLGLVLAALVSGHWLTSWTAEGLSTSGLWGFCLGRRCRAMDFTPEYIRTSRMLTVAGLITGIVALILITSSALGSRAGRDPVAPFAALFSLLTGTLLLAATILFALWYLPVRSVQMGTPRFSSPYFMEVSAAALFLFAGAMMLFESFQAEAPRVRVGAVATRIPGYSLHERPRRQGPPLWSLP